MLNDPDLRNVTDHTSGDFLSFELFDAGTWRAFRISRTALAKLSAGADLSDIESFERNVDRIKGVAFNAHKVGNGYVILNSDHFD
jgi:hypothetical protein